MMPTAEPREVIGGSESDGIDQCDAEAKQRGAAGKNVDGVVPAVGRQARATDLAGVAPLGGAHDGLNCDGGDERPKSIGSGRVDWGIGKVKRLKGDEYAAGGQHHSDYEGTEGFQAAVPVRML